MKSEIYSLPGFSEPVSSLSHLVGTAVFALLALWIVVRGRGDRLRMASLAVYGFSLVFLFSMSMMFHMMPRRSAANLVFERLDHAAIFILIAGTFTPPHVILHKGWARWGSLALVWTAALVGLTIKTVFFSEIPHWVGMSMYLALGWVGVFGAVAVTRRYGRQFAAPLWGGAMAYTVGALYELRGHALVPGVVGAHEVWHVAVLVAAGLHWAFIYQFAGGCPGENAAELCSDEMIG